MNAVTFQVTDELLEKIKSAADSRAQPVDAFVTSIMNDVIREFEAEQRFRERATRGQGREEEALELLRRP
jgi:hypothetical protein